jgi:hypothetical protein
MVHDSDSGEQSAAEPLILAVVEKALGVPLQRRSLTLENGARVDVDGVAVDGSVFVEIYAHQGSLNGGNKRKVATDALKLIAIGHEHPGSNLVLAFADPEVVSWATGRSWLAAALRTSKIRVLAVELDEDVRAGLRAAQVRQFR